MYTEAKLTEQTTQEFRSSIINIIREIRGYNIHKKEPISFQRNDKNDHWHLNLNRWAEKEKGTAEELEKQAKEFSQKQLKIQRHTKNERKAKGCRGLIPIFDSRLSRKRE